MTQKVRELIVRQRTALINAPRCHLADFGIVAAQGSVGFKVAFTLFQADQDDLPAMACSAAEG
jgi:transposase